MRELRIIWLFCGILAVTADVACPTEEDDDDDDKREEVLDPANISRYGQGCITITQSLTQFTTMHPSDQKKLPKTKESNKSSKLSLNQKPVKKVNNKTLKVSSDKVHNGGRKGPMSGATNQGSSVPMPILIPFPIIPVQGQGNAIQGAGPAQGGSGQKKKKKVQKSSSNNDKRYDGKRADKTVDKQNNLVNKHLIQLTNRQENASADVPKSGNVSIERLKRDTTDTKENILTEEERDLRDKWLHPREEDLIPGAESNYYDARDVAFIEESQRNLKMHVRDAMSILQKYKRSLLDEDTNNDEHQLRQTRDVDDSPMVESAMKKLQEAERAAQALTNIELEVGVDPMHLVENTHRYVDKLSGDKVKYDAAIRSHIVQVGQAIRRSMTNRSTHHNDTSVLSDINAAKRQLEEDRSKLEEVNTELKELKDIELMAAGLEVAKYVAKERALENLAAARSSIQKKPDDVDDIDNVDNTSATSPAASDLVKAPPPSPMVTPARLSPVPVAPAAPVAPPAAMMAPIQQPASSNPASPSWTSNQANSNFYPQYNTMSNPMYASNDAQYLQYQQPSRVESYLAPNEKVKPMSVVSPYKDSKSNKVGTPDHEITKIEQTHKADDNKEANSDSGDTHDWGGMLTFPGTTYSPPPSWLQGQQNQNDPFARQHQQPSTQTANTNSNAPPTVPYTGPATYRPVTTEDSAAAKPEPQASSLVNSPQLNQPYSLSEALASTLRRPNDGVSAASYIQNQRVNTNLAALNAQSNFAKANMDAGSANAGEVIRVTPLDETFTIHSNKNPSPAAALPSISAPPVGSLPGWMGAVDSAKYAHDVSDRLRQPNGETYVKTAQTEVKKGMENLKNAEGHLYNVKVASKAVTGIEKAVGLDTASIVKMIDFVKRSAVDDVKQSTDIVNKDIHVLNHIKEEIVLKKSNVGVGTGVVNPDNVALSQAALKLKDGEHVLADARDRLSKISKMEMLVTGIEVAKYYASEKAAVEVQGYKRTLKDAIKRTKVPKDLISKLSVINKKH